jgi:hypothetical protein
MAEQDPLTAEALRQAICALVEELGEPALRVLWGTVEQLRRAAHRPRVAASATQQLILDVLAAQPLGTELGLRELVSAVQRAGATEDYDEIKRPLRNLVSRGLVEVRRDMRGGKPHHWYTAKRS